ncbi:hypothetical protein [Jannaschia formosa]|uniref:hypothetical protein n=1 Tax=Jannaschia formosa TaxID=2259592 RepID=UPI000E1B90B8|nr:hypothetical protein [Jannaschia formosa]TFL16414.1 hypothetical protein DR046_20030 [Jannaschia formosa]
MTPLPPDVPSRPIPQDATWEAPPERDDPRSGLVVAGIVILMAVLVLIAASVALVAQAWPLVTG